MRSSVVKHFIVLAKHKEQSLIKTVLGRFQRDWPKTNGRHCLIWLVATIPTANTATIGRLSGYSFSNYKATAASHLTDSRQGAIVAHVSH